VKTCLAALLFTILPQAAGAAALDQFRDGRFAEAATAGRSEATAASLLLAGRAALIVAAFETTDKARALSLVEAAEHDFDASLAKAPANNDALLQKATAIGYRAKLTRSPGLAKETRQLMEAAVAREPGNGLAWASIGGWHAASISTLGKFVAGTLIGAKLDTALKDFDTALAKEPKNLIHRVYYAFTLLDLDPGNTVRAAALLREAERLPARDGYEALIKRGSAQVLPLLDRGDTRAARLLAKRLLPFGALA